MSEILDQAKRLAQIHYESGSTSAVYASGSVVTNTSDDIRLVEVNDDTIPSGIVPLRFGPLPEMGITHCSTIVEVTASEFKQIQDGELPLPADWGELEQIYPLPDTVDPGR